MLDASYRPTIAATTTRHHDDPNHGAVPPDVHVEMFPDDQRPTTPGALTCSVVEGVEHAVQVSAASLYEAAVMGMAEFRRCGFADATFGPATRLKIRVKGPEAEHTVAVAKVRAAGGWARSPIERLEKNRLKELLS
jgi:hypothetical protein